MVLNVGVYSPCKSYVPVFLYLIGSFWTAGAIVDIHYASRTIDTNTQLSQQQQHESNPKSHSNNAIHRQFTPWQTDKEGGTQSSSSGTPYDASLQRRPHLFAPRGRIPSIEQALETVSSPHDSTSNLVVALPCRTGFVVVSTAGAPLNCPNAWTMFPPTNVTSTNNTNNNTSAPKATDDQNATATKEEDDQNISQQLLLKEGEAILSVSTRSSSSTFVPLIISHGWTTNKGGIFAISAGNAMHSHTLRRRIQAQAKSLDRGDDDGTMANNRNKNSGRISTKARLSVSRLARRLADQCQTSTQTSGGKTKMLVSSALLVDSTNGGSLWQIDPTGQFWECQVAILGRGAKEAQHHLLDKIRSKQKKENTTPNQTNATTVIADDSNKHHDNKDGHDKTNSGGDGDDYDESHHLLLMPYLNNLTVSEATQLALECIQTSLKSMDKKQSSQQNQPPQLLPDFSLLTSLDDATLMAKMSSSSLISSDNHNGARLPCFALFVPFD